MGKRVLIVVLALFLSMVTVSAQEAPVLRYNEYIAQYAGEKQPLQSIVLSSDALTDMQNADLVNGLLHMTNDQGLVVWRFSVPETGLYCLRIAYCAMVSKHDRIEFSLYLDDALPFLQAAQFMVPRAWQNAAAAREDSRGNQIRSEQIQAERWQSIYLQDPEGLRSAPLQFYLEEGEHTLTLAAARTDFLLKPPVFEQAPVLPEYVPPAAVKRIEGIAPIKVEGEQAAMKSDSTLYPTYDRSDPATSPAHPTRMLLNTIGGSNWKRAYDWIEWTFDVPADGHYSISFRARQNLQSGINASRRIYLDGAVPFAELQNVPFSFSNDWYQQTLGEETPYLFYLTAGTHTLRMENVPGPMGDIISEMQQAVYQLNDQYRRIIMVTGVTPDPYRDYQIYRDLPTLLDEMRGLASLLKDMKQQMGLLSDGAGDSRGMMETVITQLTSFVDRPDTIPLRLKEFKANISSLSAWLLALGEQPLEIDYFYVAPGDEMPQMSRSGAMEQMAYNAQSLIGSFGTDYRMVGDFAGDVDAISVWVGMGRDQVQIIKDLIDNDFAPNYAVKVNVNLVQQGLIEATLAGKGPDIALFVNAADPVNLAARGALMDVSKLADYGEIASRFHPEALVPFEYEGGIYALPVTQTFPMMFYRKDIFQELGIAPPDTWNDVYTILPVLQRNSLDMGIGSDIGTFATLLFQRGGSFYNEQRTGTDFGSEKAMRAFAQWTDFFTKYDLPLTFDFQNRFRTGEMPIGIAPYTLYNILQVAAPEIKNMWEMLPVPGTEYPDGTVNRNVCGGSQIQGAILFSKTRNMDAAWKFLQWFTSARVQAQLGIALEAQMGAAGRYPTANREALQYLPWSQAQLAVLYRQWESVREIPEIPASYYISRNIINAFRAVKYDFANPRHTINLYSAQMDQEILRKREEFGLPNE